jgi:hypothetical protein
MLFRADWFSGSALFGYSRRALKRAACAMGAGGFLLPAGLGKPIGVGVFSSPVPAAVVERIVPVESTATTSRAPDFPALVFLLLATRCSRFPAQPVPAGLLSSTALPALNLCLTRFPDSVRCHMSPLSEGRSNSPARNGSLNGSFKEPLIFQIGVQQWTGKTRSCYGTKRSEVSSMLKLPPYDAFYRVAC